MLNIKLPMYSDAKHFVVCERLSNTMLLRDFSYSDESDLDDQKYHLYSLEHNKIFENNFLNKFEKEYYVLDTICSKGKLICLVKKQDLVSILLIKFNDYYFEIESQYDIVVDENANVGLAWIYEDECNNVIIYIAPNYYYFNQENGETNRFDDEFYIKNRFSLADIVKIDDKRKSLFHIGDKEIWTDKIHNIINDDNDFLYEEYLILGSLLSKENKVIAKCKQNQAISYFCSNNKKIYYGIIDSEVDLEKFKDTIYYDDVENVLNKKFYCYDITNNSTFEYNIDYDNIIVTNGKIFIKECDKLYTINKEYICDLPDKYSYFRGDFIFINDKNVFNFISGDYYSTNDGHFQVFNEELILFESN